MDSHAREALAGFIRTEVSRDLDRLSVEVRQLRHQVEVLERMLLPPGPRGQAERRERAAAMRAEGLSVRAIAAVTQSTRSTITSDLRQLGVEPPAGQVVGLDGRVTSPQLRSPAGP